jgi:hypothetical protein
VTVDAALEQCGRHLVRARAGVVVHEAARVGHEADVERLADRRRELDAELLHQVPDHLRRARRVAVDPVDGAEARVVVVVVDVEDPVVLVLELVGAGAVDVAAVQEHQHALAEVRRRLGDEPLQAQEAVLVGQRELVGGHERERVLADRRQHELHRGQRADRVTVGALVRGQQEAVGLADRVHELGATGARSVLRAHREPRSASSASSSSWMRRPRSSELS